ncbi:1-aminocyclopropane-1-carboxylate synthase [Trifolium repens]|nr:1-aminocyclopropane-1-carboxylate synthase [Trifolium repens]
MKKTNQTKKTKDLESMPNFSLGLTPSEEEGGKKDKKDGLQNPDVANPLADFHFLMINYLDKMGKRSPLLTDTCPLSKAEEYLDHYRGCIRIYNGAIQTLERRIAEDVGTSEKQHAISQKQKGEDDESENDDSEDTESDDTAGNSDVKRVNSDENEHENDENDNESDEDEVAKTISKESKEAGYKGAGAANEVGESSNAQRFNNDQNEINAELLDESVKAACNVGLTLTQETIIKFPQIFEGGETKDAEFNNENQSDEDVEINLELLDESVKAACNVGMTLTQETIEKFPQYFDGGETKHAELTKNDSETKDSDSQGMDTVTQETISKFPQFFQSDLNKTQSVSQGSDSVTAETIRKYPEFFDAGEASTKKECSQSLALVLYEAPPNVKHEDKSDSDVCIDATPLRSVLPDEVIDVDSAEPVKKKKRRTHDMLYSSGPIPERKRPLKKSKYLSSPYDEAVHESKATKKQKDLATYAWSDVLDKDEGDRTRLVTPLVNYVDQEKMAPKS